MAGALSLENTIAVDFDLRQNVWRTVNTTGVSNMTLNAAVIIATGSWSNTTAKEPHMKIPELGLLIPSMHYFRKNCYFEPFMKVFNTSGLTQEKIDKMAKRDWSSDSEKEVVMRTASFGHGINKISVCARKEDYTVISPEGEDIVRKGLGDNVVVPLGLMAVLRRQKLADHKSEYPCTMD
jgi:hypothetical protein